MRLRMAPGAGVDASWVVAIERLRAWADLGGSAAPSSRSAAGSIAPSTIRDLRSRTFVQFTRSGDGGARPRRSVARPPAEGHHSPGASSDRSWACRPMHLPEPRGPLSEALVPRPRHPHHAVRRHLECADRVADGRAACALTDDDLQLSLAVCYELHYRGFDGVADDWEWDPALLRLRARPRAPAPGRAARPGRARSTVDRRADRPAARRAHRRRRRPVAVLLHGQAAAPSSSGGST